LNTEELERELRKSPMDYCLKANLYLRGVAFMPCPDCHEKWLPENENSFLTTEKHSIPFSEKIDECLLSLIEGRLKNCPFEIMVWILSEDQFQLWEKLRSPEMKRRGIEKAINEHKMLQVEASLGRALGSISLPFF